jgi:hypothetical protein
LSVIQSVPSTGRPKYRVIFPVQNWIVFGVIFVIEVLQSSASLAGFPGPWRYYAYQWTVSYADGFTRRGLLGSLLRLLHLDNGNYLLIAACGWLITFSLFWLVVKVLLRLLAPLEPVTRSVLVVALLLSPVTTGLLVQATGDPIQLILLVYLALTLFLPKPGGSAVSAARLVLIFLVFGVFGVASILTHEASLFFVGPGLLLAAFFVRRSGVDRAALLGYILGAVPTLLLTIHFTENHRVAAIAPMHLGASQMVANSTIRLDTFSSLLAEETGTHFHNGMRGYVLTMRNAVGTLLLPLFFAMIVSHVLRGLRLGWVNSGRRGMLAFVFPLVLSAPLWVIAHDWGRFSSYLFLVTLTILSLASPTEATPSPEKLSPEKLSPELPPLLIGTLLVLSGLATSRALTSYILKGVGDDLPTMIAVILLCSMGIWSLFFKSSSAHRISER